VPIGVSLGSDLEGTDYYRALQCFAPHQIAYAHTNSEEWVTVLGGNG
jgi:hypothetical protein